MKSASVESNRVSSVILGNIPLSSFHVWTVKGSMGSSDLAGVTVRECMRGNRGEVDVRAGSRVKISTSKCSISSSTKHSSKGADMAASRVVSGRNASIGNMERERSKGSVIEGLMDPWG